MVSKFILDNYKILILERILLLIEKKENIVCHSYSNYETIIFIPYPLKSLLVPLLLKLTNILYGVSIFYRHHKMGKYYHINKNFSSITVYKNFFI